MAHFDHPETKALLRAVLAAPDDNAPRLVLADWLDENGFSQRAEFIRRQIELSLMSKDDPRHFKLFRAMRAIAVENEPEWLKVERPKSCKLETIFRRGFLGEAHGSPAQWLRSAAGLLRVAPIRKAQIDIGFFGLFRDSRFPEFTQSPELARLSRLTLQSWTLSDQEARALAESPYLVAIERIRIGVIMNGRGAVTMSAAAERLLRKTFGDRLRMEAERPQRK